MREKTLIQSGLNLKYSWVYEPPRDKTTTWFVLPAKSQISLGFRPVWSQSSLCAQWVAKDPSFFMRTAKTLIRLGRCPSWSESSLGAHAILLVLLVTGRFAHFLVRPESFRPRVVSPSITWVTLHYVSHLALLSWVVSPTTWWVVSPTFWIFYWGYCDKFTVFVSFNEEFGHVSLKNDRSFISWSKWGIPISPTPVSPTHILPTPVSPTLKFYPIPVSLHLCFVPYTACFSWSYSKTCNVWLLLVMWKYATCLWWNYSSTNNYLNWCMLW